MNEIFDTSEYHYETMQLPNHPCERCTDPSCLFAVKSNLKVVSDLKHTSVVFKSGSLVF